MLDRSTFARTRTKDHSGASSIKILWWSNSRPEKTFVIKASPWKQNLLSWDFAYNVNHAVLWNGCFYSACVHCGEQARLAEHCTFLSLRRCSFVINICHKSHLEENWMPRFLLHIDQREENTLTSGYSGAMCLQQTSFCKSNNILWNRNKKSETFNQIITGLIGDQACGCVFFSHFGVESCFINQRYQLYYLLPPLWSPEF